MNRMIRGVLLGALLMAGCGGRAAETCDDGYTIAAAAKDECRAPDQAGCDVCCVEAPTGCFTRKGAPFGEWGSVDPWYNGSAGDCPTTCAPCASCLERDERELCDLLANRLDGCDCATVEIGIDPCVQASCACWCERYQWLSAACPRQ